MAKNEQTYAKKLLSFSSRIPANFRTCTTPLFRGMTVNEDFINKANSSTGLDFNTFTSWSVSEKMAMKFINDPAYKVSNGGGTAKIKILIKRVPKPNEIVLHIFNYVLFLGWMLPSLGLDELSLDSAEKEQEVLLKPKIKIKMSDITII